MYTDMDSILNQETRKSPVNAAKRWISRITNAVLTREDLCVLYGCWADDAATSELVDPVDGVGPRRFAYAV